MKIFSRNFLKIIVEKFGGMKKTSYLCNAKAKRAFSSAGSEHLPYKQRVGGSNPSTPTTKPIGNQAFPIGFSFFITTLIILIISLKVLA